MRFLFSFVFLTLFFIIIAYAAPKEKTKAESFALSQPKIVTRAEWGAKPGIKRLMKAQEIKYITIHHSAVRQSLKRSLERKLRGLQGFSQRSERLASGKMKKAWGDIPYHFYISADGRIGEGRETKWAGDTNTNYNPVHHLQIVLEGNFQKDQPTSKQLASLTRLVRWAKSNWSVPMKNIGAHMDHARTLCPGKNLLPHLAKHDWRRNN